MEVMKKVIALLLIIFSPVAGLAASRTQGPLQSGANVSPNVMGAHTVARPTILQGEPTQIQRDAGAPVGMPAPLPEPEPLPVPMQVVEVIDITPSVTDRVVGDILARFNSTRASAELACGRLPLKFNSLRTAAGVGVGAGVVGAVAGGTATTVGILRLRDDEQIRNSEHFEHYEKWLADPCSVTQLAHLQSAAQIALMLENSNRDLYGTIRTVGAFTAGAAGTVGAIVSFRSAGDFDNLIEDMEICSSNVQEIDNMASELRFAAPGTPEIEQMNRIVAACRGLNTSNISDVQGRMRAAGVFGAVGGVAGIAGGITSVIAQGQGVGESRNMDIAATVASGVAAAGTLGSAILSGATLSGLNRNSEIANTCAEAF
jgi:hypothetical protein